MGYQQRQAAAEKRQASALALASRLDADARSAKTELRAADLRRQAQAARDAAASAQEDSSTAGNLAAQFSEKAKTRKTEMAKADENRKAMRDLSIVVKQNGDPRVIGAFLRALKEGASPEAAELIVTGTMKTKDWERAQAAKKPELTPEQKAAEKVAEDVALANERRKNYRDVSTGKPLPTEEEWQADMLKSALAKYEADTRETRDLNGARSPVRWDTFTDDEVAALMNAKDVAAEVRTQAREEFNKREVPRAIGDATRGVKIPMPFAGGGDPGAAPKWASDPAYLALSPEDKKRFEARMAGR